MNKQNPVFDPFEYRPFNITPEEFSLYSKTSPYYNKNSYNINTDSNSVKIPKIGKHVRFNNIDKCKEEQYIDDVKKKKILLGKALKSYEIYYNLLPGTATIKDLEKEIFTITEWANYDNCKDLVGLKRKNRKMKRKCRELLDLTKELKDSLRGKNLSQPKAKYSPRHWNTKLAEYKDRIYKLDKFIQNP